MPNLLPKVSLPNTITLQVRISNQKLTRRKIKIIALNRTLQAIEKKLTKSWFFEKINKMAKLTRLIELIKEKVKIRHFINEKRPIKIIAKDYRMNNVLSISLIFK